MASGDLYSLRLRFSSDDTSFMNTLYYVQDEDTPPGTNGSAHLLDVCADSNSVFSFFLAKMSNLVKLVCAEASRVVWPGSGIEPQITIRFYTDKIGLIVQDSLPIDSTAVYEVVGEDAIPGKRAPISLIYMSGIPETLVDGVNFTMAVQTALTLSLANIVSPPQTGGDPQFQLAVKSQNAANGKFSRAAYLNVPCYPSKRRSRKKRLC